MKIVIIGAGSTGTMLASRLIQEGHTVSLIESNEEKARHASNRLDCYVIHDEGNNPEALVEAGITGANALICVTESDEVNMIICGLAASLCPDKKSEHAKSKNKTFSLPWFKQGTSGLLKIARVRNTGYMAQNLTLPDKDKKTAAVLKERNILGIDYFVHPDVEAAKAVLIALSHGASGNILSFPGTPYELGSINVREGSTFDGLSLMDFHSFVRDEGIISLVERGNDCFLPAGSTTLFPGDLIHIITRKENMEQVFHLAGKTELPLKRIGIVGGGRMGCLIAEGLLTNYSKSFEMNNPAKGVASFIKSFIPKSDRQVILIEQNYSVCKDLAARFPEALILNEDISDENFVAEERIGDLDLIITATANQELNIIAAVYLKSKGVRRAIALVSGTGYKTIALQLGVDVAIPMNSVVADSILSHLSGRGVRDIYSIGDGSVSIIEVEIEENSPAAEKTITEFKLSSGGLIILVNREDKAFIPQGDYVFKPADKVIIIVKNGSDAEINKFFGTSKEGIS